MKGPTRDRIAQARVAEAMMALAVALLCLVLASCADLEPGRSHSQADLSSLRGRLTTGRDVLLLAGPGAEKASVGLFRYGRLGVIYLFMSHDLDGHYEVRLEVGRHNSDTGFNYRFGEEPPVFNRRADAAHRLTLQIPQALLVAGVHRLQLSVAEGSWIQIRQAQVVEVDDQGREMRVLDRFDDYETRSLMADFLETGLAGRGVARAGTLIHGALERTAPLDLQDDGTLTGWLVNLGSKPVVVSARFQGRSETIDLGAGEASRVELAASAGRTELSISVETSQPTRSLVLLGAPRFEPRNVPERTPVLLITLDTTRRDALGIYTDGAGTPNLSAFAAAATTFEAAFAVAPWTLPNHASMLTGLYPFEHDAGVRSPRLDLARDSAAELLRSAGYRTAGFAGGYMCHHRWGIGQGFDEYHDPEGFESSADVITERVLSFLDTVTDRPFFLFANYFDPHSRYSAPEEFRQASGALERRETLPVESSAFRRLALGKHEPWRALLKGEVDGSAVENEYLRAEYEAEVLFMDHQLGRVFDRLKDLDLYERMLIVILADHGEMLGEKGFYGHGARLDQEQVSIPMMVKWPYQREATRVSEIVSPIDVFPTILDAAGIDLEDNRTSALRLSPDGYVSGDRSFVLQEEHYNGAHTISGPMFVGNDVLAVQSSVEQFWWWEGGRLCQARSSIREPWSERDCDSMDWPTGEFARFEVEGAILVPADDSELNGEDREALEALGYLDSER